MWGKKFNFLLILILASCNRHDDVSKGQLNGFSYEKEFYKLDNAYYFISTTGLEQQEFFIILSNGKVESFSIFSNSFVFSKETTSAVVLNGGKFSETPIPTNRIPTGLYNFNSNETSDNIVSCRFDFECSVDFVLNSFETCQNSVNTWNNTPSSASLSIEYNETSKEHILSYNFNFSDNKKIIGDFRGPIEISNQIL